MDQLAAAIQCGAESVIADFRDLNRCGDAVRAALAGASILLATPRIHKPGENSVLDELAQAGPDGMLVRNLAGLAFCRGKGLPAVADFCLNAANDLTVEWLRPGARRVTAAYDLSRERLLDLAAVVLPERLEVVVHRHLPMFHSEYCLFCRALSSGQPGRLRPSLPAARHSAPRSPGRGASVAADSQCRNTLFHAEAESLSEILPSLQQPGVRHFRVELLREEGVEQVRRTLATYLSGFFENCDCAACGFATDDDRRPILTSERTGGRDPAAAARFCCWPFRCSSPRPRGR